MYHSTYHPRRKTNIILPFFILIVIGLIFVLAFQLWSYFKEKNIKLTENKAALTITAGEAEIMVWGDNKWLKALTGAVLREGDSLHTLPNSRASLSLQNGSFIRLDFDTEFEIRELRTKNGHDASAVFLKYGDLWLKKTKAKDATASFTVETENLNATSTATIFAVAKRTDTKIRVMEGGVIVNIKEKVDSKYRNIESIRAGVGQEVVIGDKELKAFKERKEADTLFAISDNFRTSEWYAWNIAQDKAPQALTVAEAIKIDSEAKTTIEPEKTESKPEESVSIFPSPEIIEPDTSHRRTRKDRIIVKGETSENTQKIIVKTFVGGKEDSYTLQKYVPNKTEWTYIAAEAQGNLVPGENRYEIIAVDKNGKQSEPSQLILIYEKEKAPADLSAPSILTYNGLASNETKDTAVRVEGKIGKGIVKVFVNDFQLTRYVPDSLKWVYYAKVEYGNLKEGENEYEVYGMDADGKKTPVTKFKIIKLPEE